MQQKQQQYTAGIADNVEHPCNITITVVGHNGVGKSCFVRQLKQERIPEGGPGATDTADLYVNYLGYDPKTGFRQTLDKDGEMETGRQRLKRIIDRHWKEGKNDDQASASTPDVPPSMAGSPLSPPKKTGLKQKLKQFFSKFLSRRKTKGTMENIHKHSADVQHLNIPQEQKHVMDESMDTQMKEEEVQHVDLSHEQSSVIEDVMKTDVQNRSDKEVKGFVTIYDFGGEKVFYNTHHCLMSSNMVFVLVFNVAMCLDPDREKDGYERIEFWLKSIATYAIDRAAHGKGTPPVILVGSHLDLVSPDKKTQDESFASVLKKLCGKPEIKEIMETHVQEMFSIANLNDSTKHKDTYDRVWNTILEIAPLQSQWEQPVPARWVALEHELVRLKNESDSVILTYADLLDINRKLVVPLAEHDIMNFLWRVRLSGSFLCFDLHSKKPFIVLRPQWIIHAFKAIITDPKFTANLSPKLKLQWEHYQSSGVLTVDVIRKLWGFHTEHKFLEHQEKLFIVMETLGLLTNPLPVDAKEEIGRFIVPSILQTANPAIIRPVLDDPFIVTTATICLKFENPFIPQAVWDKMIAACIHRFQRLKEQGYDDLAFIQRGFACLSWYCRWNIIINCSKNAMKITLFKKDTDNSVPTGTGINLLKILEFLLQQILELSHQSHLEYQLYLHNDYRFTADEKMVKVDDVRQQTSHLQCYGSNGCGWIGRDDLFVWFNDPDQKKTKRTHKLHVDFVDVTTDLPDRNLSFKEIGRVSKHIGDTYRTFFVDLDCSLAIVEQESVEHRHLTFRSIIAKIFIQLHKTGADTRFATLADAMSRHGMDPTTLLTIMDCNRHAMFNGETLSETWLQQPLTVNDVAIIADHVGIKAYFNLFLELGFSPNKVDEFDDQYKYKGTKVKITAMLDAFIKETTPLPTVNTILLAMQECIMDTGSLISDLKPTQTTSS